MRLKRVGYCDDKVSLMVLVYILEFFFFMIYIVFFFVRLLDVLRIMMIVFFLSLMVLFGLLV